MSLRGTETAKNLTLSYVGESQARNRYTFFAEAARKEGLEKIAEIFEETANNERAHAKCFFESLQKGGAPAAISVQVDAGLPGIKTTYENLMDCVAGERAECEEIYPHFADVAEREGFKQIARQWRQIAEVEKRHQERYQELANQVKEGRVFKRQETMRWKCRNCGYISVGAAAPKVCPVCFKPQGWFEVEELLP